MSIKGKDKGRKILAHTSFQIFTRSFTKVFAQHIDAPATTVVVNLTATPIAPAPDPLAAPFHSGATIPSVPRKRMVVVLDTSATSSERSSSASLIKNMDMGEFIIDLMKTKVQPPSLSPHIIIINQGSCVDLLFYLFIPQNLTFVFFSLDFFFFKVGYINQFTTGHTLRNFMLPKTGLA
jgi:hypothetical protein